MRSAIVLVIVSILTSTAGAGTPAARQGDVTPEGCVIVGGSPNVFINGKPAARVGDRVLCPPLVNASGEPLPGVWGKILGGNPRVLINGRPMARLGSPVQVAIKTIVRTFLIATGSPSVLLGD